MILVVGLGNPGSEYEKTRHNIGFWAVDRLAQRHGILVTKKDPSFVYGKGRIASQDAILIKPTTYMNESGLAVSRAMSKIADDEVGLDDVHVFHDEVDLELGRLKVKQGGSENGHRGLLSVTKHVGADYIRYRMGVGRPRPGGQDVADYVLDTFKKSEADLAVALSEWACDSLELILSLGLAKAQNQIHRQEKPTGF